jgi:hypothetical protein
MLASPVPKRGVLTRPAGIYGIRMGGLEKEEMTKPD